jgi:acetyl-CoA carboxylase carboxyl transferase subunit alpha
MILDFERPVAEIETKLAELRRSLPNAPEIARLEARVERARRELFGKLTPIQRTQIARHPDRPHFEDYVRLLVDDFTPLSGDRLFGEDAAIVGGPGRWLDRPVMLIGHEKGHDTAGRVAHNFGMARPEGYRKATRLIELAGRMRLPIVSLVDTAGAFPGIDAEERGQAEAIARATEACLGVAVPFVSVIVGEGGSGGAIAIAAANAVLMLEHAVYSVISPEGGASILFKTRDKAGEMAAAFKLTAPDLLGLGLIDGIVPEPLGGAHRDHAATAAAVGEAVTAALARMDGVAGAELRERRRAKFAAMGG